MEELKEDMGLNDDGDFRPEQRGRDLVENNINMSPMTACRGEDPSSLANPFSFANAAEQVLVNDWNLFVSMAQHMDFNVFTAPSSSGAYVQEDEGIGISGRSLIEQIPRFPCINSGDISQTMSPAALAANRQTTGPSCPTDFNPRDEQGIARNSEGKKRRKLGACDTERSPFSRIQTVEAEQKKDVITDSVKSSREEDVKKEKGEENPEANTHKLASKAAKENSSKGDAPKEEYIHLRAKRGHTTNNHSLAERARRQKISERMKFLQDLVPGCSKITGKAVMLDEIINYIQSLQRQVEFLSMKLATVNLGLNLDIHKIPSNDVLHSQTGGSDVLGFCQGLISPHPYSQRSMQAEMAIDSNPNSREALQSTLSEISPLPQISSIWQDDL